MCVTADGERAEERTRILIADEHPLFRSGLKRLLVANPEFEVIGEASTGHEAVAMSHRLRPEAVLMDVNLSGIDGIVATKTIASRCEGTAVIILTASEDSDPFFAAMRAGARGYLLKNAGVDDIGRAVDTVRRGGVAFGPGVSDWVLDQFTLTTGADKPFPELTDRERAVLELIADGRGNAAIAHELNLSIKTVRNYLSRIFAKLRIVDRSEAAVYARRAGMGQ